MVLLKAAIFDLDGVIADTAKYHYIAWKRLAAELGFNFLKKDNELLKGVSRMESLEIILKIGNIQLNDKEKKKAAQRKNEWYVEYISNIDESELLPGAENYLKHLKNKDVLIALGSASKNAGIILENSGISHYFQAIVDGNEVSNAKPNPEVFLRAAKLLGKKPAECVVFEDAQAGIDAAKKGGMLCVAVGNADDLFGYDYIIKGLYEADKIPLF